MLTAEGILKPGTGPAGKETIKVGLQSNEAAAELAEERNLMGTSVIHRYRPAGLRSLRLGSAHATSTAGGVRRDLLFPRNPVRRGRGDARNRHIVIGALGALVFVAGVVVSLIRVETLMAVVLGLGGLAFIVRTVLAVRGSSRGKDD